MEIECTHGDLNAEMLEWAEAEELWESLGLSHVCNPSDPFFIGDVVEIDVFTHYDELDGWQTVDPNSYPATISSTYDEITAKRAFYNRMIEVAYQNREKLVAALVANPLPHSDEDDVDTILHAGASGFRDPKGTK
jgi:hypothetical protein